jgi:hypothetical protein
MLHLGKDYPGGYPYFRNKLKNAFMKNSALKDQKEIDSAIARGEFVIKELEGNLSLLVLLQKEIHYLIFTYTYLIIYVSVALYMLRKYRALKKRYYEE